MYQETEWYENMFLQMFAMIAQNLRCQLHYEDSLWMLILLKEVCSLSAAMDLVHNMRGLLTDGQ